MRKKSDKTKNKHDLGTHHDAAFKSAFQRKELACDFFRHYLPEDIRKHINFEKLELVNKSYVDEKLKEKHSDIVYKTEIGRKSGLLYILFEHQSKPDFRMAFRLLCYMVNIWKEYSEQKPGDKKLPVIIPLVLYHGRGKWTAPLRFSELIKGGRKFSLYLPEFAYTLTDLSGYEDESLIGGLMLKPVLYVFKHIYDGDFDSAARTVTDMVLILQNEPDFLTFLEWFLRYLYHARTEHKETLKRIIDREINRLNTKGAKEMAMTVAEQIKKEGRLEGLKQGLEQGVKQGLEQGVKQGLEQGVKQGLEQGVKQGVKQGLEQGVKQGVKQGLKQGIEKTALNMLRMGTDMTVISQATGLSEDAGNRTERR